MVGSLRANAFVWILCFISCLIKWYLKIYIVKPKKNSLKRTDFSFIVISSSRLWVCVKMNMFSVDCSLVSNKAFLCQFKTALSVLNWRKNQSLNTESTTYLNTFSIILKSKICLDAHSQILNWLKRSGLCGKFDCNVTTHLCLVFFV